MKKVGNKCIYLPGNGELHVVVWHCCSLDTKSLDPPGDDVDHGEEGGDDGQNLQWTTNHCSLQKTCSEWKLALRLHQKVLTSHCEQHLKPTYVFCNFFSYLVDAKSETILQKLGVCPSSEKIQNWEKESLVTNKNYNQLVPNSNLLCMDHSTRPSKTKVNQDTSDKIITINNVPMCCLV